jgi:hypothetical protein
MSRKKIPKFTDRKKMEGNTNKAADQAEICGGLSTLQAFHGSKDERLVGNHHTHHHQQSAQSLQVIPSLQQFTIFRVMNKQDFEAVKHRLNLDTHSVHFL